MNSKNLVNFYLVITIVTHACTSHGVEVFRCPSEISVSWNIPAPPTGWDIPGIEASRSVIHYLVSATFSDGSPENGAFLRPMTTHEQKEGGGTIEKYDFSDRVNPTIWLVCKYGNTPATLTKSIPNELEICEVIRPKDLSQQEVRCH